MDWNGFELAVSPGLPGVPNADAFFAAIIHPKARESSGEHAKNFPALV